MIRGAIAIDGRFRGPPTSGNGGYVCGRLAEFAGGDAVVRLRLPPPLHRELQVRDTDSGVALFDGDQQVAEARPASLALDLPKPPSFEKAEVASQAYSGFDRHPFPGCFVCGPERARGDGLRVFPGAIGEDGLVASPWIPDPSLASAAGVVLPEFVWATLDCPGAFAFPHPKTGGMLLGELQVALAGEVSARERCVVVGWERERSGRKHITGTALFGESGDCRGVGLATWIEVSAPAEPPGRGV